MQKSQSTDRPSRPILTIAIPTYNRASCLKLLLQSLEAQLRNEQSVELLVSDNASQDETSQVIEQFLQRGMIIAYVRNAENVGADGNFLKCFERAKGKYVWIVGDDDILLPSAVRRILASLSKEDYELVYVSSYGFEGEYVPPQLSQTEKLRAVVFSDAGKFVKRVHVFFTLISCNIINKDRVEEIGHRPFAELLQSNLIQLGWTYTALRGLRKSLLIDEPLVAYKLANTGGYELCRVFGSTLAEVTEKWLGIPDLNRLILNAMLQRFMPGGLLATRMTRGKFVQEDAHAVLSPRYGRNVRYWLFDYPIITLPRSLAWSWFQIVRIVNRLDRAIGSPLVGD